MHIRTYFRQLEKFLRQRFNNNFNISLFFSRRLKYVHLGLEIASLSTSVSSELIAIIKDFEKKNRDRKYLFFLDYYIQQSESMIISLLRKRICSAAPRANATYFNKPKKKLKGKITLIRCYIHNVLLVTIDLEGSEIYQGRLFPALW